MTLEEKTKENLVKKIQLKSELLAMNENYHHDYSTVSKAYDGCFVDSCVVYNGNLRGQTDFTYEKKLRDLNDLGRETIFLLLNSKTPEELDAARYAEIEHIQSLIQRLNAVIEQYNSFNGVVKTTISFENLAETSNADYGFGVELNSVCLFDKAVSMVEGIVTECENAIRSLNSYECSKLGLKMYINQDMSWLEKRISDLRNMTPAEYRDYKIKQGKFSERELALFKNSMAEVGIEPVAAIHR